MLSATLCPPLVGPGRKATRLQFTVASVAQWIEYCPPKAGVAGSIPAGRTKASVTGLDALQNPRGLDVTLGQITAQAPRTMCAATSKKASRSWFRPWKAGVALIGLSAVVASGTTLATASAQSKTQPPRKAAVTELTQRCQVEMLRGTCGAMKASPSSSSTSRVFIAELGEVDGVKFAALRRAGDAMCGKVETACRTDWQSGSCKIARALYPVTAASASAVC